MRGLSPYPAAFTHIEVENKGVMDVKVLKTRITTNHKPLKPGEIEVEKESLTAGTATLPVEILELQPAGKRAMSIDAFLRGYKPLSIKMES